MMRVLFVTTEYFPYVKTGGLGDISKALPDALKKIKVDVRLLIPGYPAIIEHIKNVRLVKKWPALLGVPDVELLLGEFDGKIPVYTINAPSLYARARPYVDQHGKGWADNYLRFGVLSRVAAELYQHDEAWCPDIVHCNDWFGALAPGYLAQHKLAGRPACVLTIHNLHYQGVFAPGVAAQLELPDQEVLQKDGTFNFMESGIARAKHLTTVSPTYAREIQSPEFGCGLDDALRGRSIQLTGILNGMDSEVWNPARDRHIDMAYDAGTLQHKKLNRQALLAESGMQVADSAPIYGVVSRLTHEKGLDYLERSILPLLKQGAGLVVLGSGDRKLERDFKQLAENWPEQVAVHTGFDERRAHRILAGADAVVIPSRSEPCGLVQMYGQRYGTLPVVTKTGGLADSVDEDCGFSFRRCAPDELRNVLVSVWRTYRNEKAWRRMQQAAMKKEFSWSGAAEKYVDVYKLSISKRA